MTDIIDEINDELAKDRATQLLKKYYKYIVALLVAVVLVAGGMQGWDYFRTKQLTARSSEFSEAINLPEGGTPEDALNKIMVFINKNESDQLQTLAITRAITLAQSLKKDDEVAKLSAMLIKNNGAFLGGLEYLWVNNGQNVEKLQKMAQDDAHYAQIANFILADISLGKGESQKAREYLLKVKNSKGPLGQLADELAEKLAEK